MALALRRAGVKRRIAYYCVEAGAAAVEVLQAAVGNAYPVGHPRCHGVLAGLGAGARFNVDGRYVGTGVSLGHHQGYQARARADIENVPAGRASPCAQQDAVRAHFHGAPVLAHRKTLERKIVVRHSLYFFVVTVRNLRRTPCGRARL